MESHVALLPALPTSAVLWERSDYFSGGSVHSLDDFFANGMLLTTWS